MDVAVCSTTSHTGNDEGDAQLAVDLAHLHQPGWLQLVGEDELAAQLALAMDMPVRWET